MTSPPPPLPSLFSLRPGDVDRHGAEDLPVGVLAAGRDLPLLDGGAGAIVIEDVDALVDGVEGGEGVGDGRGRCGRGGGRRRCGCAGP